MGLEIGLCSKLHHLLLVSHTTKLLIFNSCKSNNFGYQTKTIQVNYSNKGILIKSDRICHSTLHPNPRKWFNQAEEEKYEEAKSRTDLWQQGVKARIMIR